jgi:hypothetical protein
MAGSAKFSEPLFEELERLFSQYPELRCGAMFGYPAFFRGQKMFLCVYGDGIGLKLPETKVNELLTLPDFTPFRPYGKPKMREWVFFEPPVEAVEAHLELFHQSHEFVAR